VVTVNKNISGQQLGKPVPTTMNKHATTESLLDCAEGTKSVERQFCTGGCEDRTKTCEAEESPMLEAAVREQLVKTQQAGKGLVGVVVIGELWRSAIAL
jgi:hypothetical protein